MGLTIHYSGKFNPKASLAEMIDEVTEIAKTYNWEYHIFEKAFPESGFSTGDTSTLYGMCFSPPESEPVWLSFLSNGRLCSAGSLMAFGNSTDKKEQKYLYMAFTKTQFAGEQVHKLIVHILKYISKKYLKNFKVTDEGHYWETLDEIVLEENFSRYREIFELVTDSLKNLPLKSGETFDEYFERMIKDVNKRRRK